MVGSHAIPSSSGRAYNGNGYWGTRKRKPRPVGQGLNSGERIAELCVIQEQRQHSTDRNRCQDKGNKNWPLISIPKYKIKYKKNIKKKKKKKKKRRKKS